MGETTHFHHHHHQPPPTTASSRLGLRSAGGEIVEVQGGHIVRSTGRKDRHSKVCTAKGPRDRRVRLSAHTAIQFYDVQDRLGYDRPSKAVDWLIKKAKAAIDELAELPAWKPTNTTPAADSAAAAAAASFDQQEPPPEQNRHHQIADNENHFQQQQLQMGENDNSNSHNNSSSFLPPSMDSDSIADTIKSFFPIGANSTANPNSSSSGGMQFQSFPPPDLLSRTSSQSQDLRLSLQSFQDPIHFHQNNHHQNDQPNHHNLFSGPTNLGFDWAENGGGFQRMVGFGGGGGGGEMFSGPMQTPPFLQPLFGHQSASQFFTTQQQRGPLQSSNTPPVRAWIDPMSAFSAAGLDHQQQLAFHHHHPQQHGGGGGISGFASSAGGGFSGFRIPARIQGDEEEHDGISDKPSSASSDSRH